MPGESSVDCPASGKDINLSINNNNNNNNNKKLLRIRIYCNKYNILKL